MAQSSAAAPSPTPGLPENFDLVEFTGWNGIDTKPPRSGVDREHCAWCDNLMPLGPNNLRAMPNIGDALYVAPSGLHILDIGFYGLQPNGVNSGPYMLAFLSDGSAVFKSVNSGTTGQIAPPGTFPTVDPLAPAWRQWGTIYLLMTTASSRNGYWIWDGSVLYTAGTIGPEVQITDAGIGYTSVPTVGIVGGSGGGATFTATILNGSVDLVTPTAAGSGWLVTDAPQALLTFTGGGSGTTAYAFATVANGTITNAAIVDGGTGYTTSSVINITDATGTGASIVITGLSSGVITALQVTAGGHNYSNPTISATIGSGFIGTVTVQNGVITGFTGLHGGSGYGSTPSVFFLSATGSGASGTAVIGAGGSVTNIILGGAPQTATGSGYPTGANQVVIGFAGGNGPASAVVQLMPFGISGDTIEVYNSQVWIATTFRRVKTFFSTPDSVSNFSPAQGGGVFPATDSILRYQWTRLLESNGFLYLIGDSSVNYISGVQTTGTPPITTFSNLNVDPQIGSPYRNSCTVYSRAIMMVNSFGVHAIYGGAVQKVSTPLDGVFNSVPNPLTALPQGPQSAIATIFGVHVYVLLLPILDAVTQVQRNALLLWDGKRWWTASPGAGGLQLTLLTTLEWGSTITAYGSDGQTVWPLFVAPSDVQKLLRSRLSSEPTIIQEKKPLQMYALWSATGRGVELDFTIDTENSLLSVTQGAFRNDALNPKETSYWGRSVVPDSLGFTVGFTMRSNSEDFTLVHHTILQQNPRRMKV